MFVLTSHSNGLLSIDSPGNHTLIDFKLLTGMNLYSSGSIIRSHTLNVDYRGGETVRIHYTGNIEVINDLLEKIRIQWNEYKRFLGVYENSSENPVVIPTADSKAIIYWGANTVLVPLKEFVGLTLFPKTLVINLTGSYEPITFISDRNDYLTVIRKGLEEQLKRMGL